MSKIKYINCFGTSFTAGGGFEFDGVSIGRCEFLKSFYGELGEPLTQFNFSYPGQLQRLLSNIKVSNYAKNGYGNDRLMRLTYELISSPNFIASEHIFLFEFSGLGRKEFWYEPFNDYIIMNYWIDWDTKKLKREINLGHSYCYDSKETEDLLKKEEPLFLQLHTITFDLENEIKKYQQEIDFFIAYLQSKNINYFMVNSVLSTDSERQFIFGDGVVFNISDDINKFTHLNNLEIDIETNYMYNDKHNGYVSNKIIGQTIYNTLIDKGYLNLNKIDIDYIGLKNIKLPKYNII